MDGSSWARGLAAIAAVGALVVSGCGAASGGSGGCTATGYEDVRDVRYGASPGTAASLQSLDLYLPELPDGCGPVPVVVWVHGGGFQRGDKARAEHFGAQAKIASWKDQLKTPESPA